jgi:hypothetical protein
MKLDKFIGMMTGHFDNKEQFDIMQKAGKIYPYAEHINTICNDKIKNIPKDFNGKFVVEESYYETIPLFQQVLPNHIHHQALTCHYILPLFLLKFYV